MNKNMQIIREVNIQAEYFYANAIQLGNHAAYALKKSHRSQLTGLENLANSALKVSDILDYVKRQTARFPYWREGFPCQEEPTKEAFGKRLLDYLENDLKDKSKIICNDRLKIGDKTEEDRHLRRKVHLLLIRQFLRQMIIQYEFNVSFESNRRGA
ncbi:MAG: hypothetical protein E6J34_16145 [Chloroflexi bacterium]|nr:MAG: hypothetical protein E6J34_16145 [Chloroflexota bacterium]